MADPFGYLMNSFQTPQYGNTGYGVVSPGMHYLWEFQNPKSQPSFLYTTMTILDNNIHSHNTQYTIYSFIECMVKMEYVFKITIFDLKMMWKAVFYR